MTVTSKNPIAQLGAPPTGDNTEEQLQYMLDALTAFEEEGNKRVKPIKRRLIKAIADLGQGINGDTIGPNNPTLNQEKAEAAIERCGKVIDQLRIASFGMLRSVVDDVVAKMETALRQGKMPNEDKLTMKQMQKGMKVYSRAVRLFSKSVEQKDSALEAEATRLFEESSALMTASHNETNNDANNDTHNDTNRPALSKWIENSPTSKYLISE